MEEEPKTKFHPIHGEQTEVIPKKSFKVGDPVVHKSDSKPRQMVIKATKEDQSGLSVPEKITYDTALLGSPFFCTWIDKTKVGSGFFSEDELAYQDS